MMMDALIYGVTLSANSVARENEPPVSMSM